VKPDASVIYVPPPYVENTFYRQNIF